MRAQGSPSQKRKGRKQKKKKELTTVAGVTTTCGGRGRSLLDNRRLRDKLGSLFSVCSLHDGEPAASAPVADGPMMLLLGRFWNCSEFRECRSVACGGGGGDGGDDGFGC